MAIRSTSTGLQLGVPVRTYPAAKITAADFTLTTDQPFVWLTAVPTLYAIRRVIARRASGAFSIACLGGVYDTAAKGGNALVAAAQSWANLTGAGKIVDATLAAVIGTSIITSSTIFLSLSTGSSAALTADVYLFIDELD